MANTHKFLELEKRLNSVKAEDVMTRSVITTRKDIPMSNLAEDLLAKKISGVPVIDENGQMCGIITATDLFALMFMLKTGQMVEGDQRGVCDPTVEWAMVKDVLTVGEKTSLDEIMKIMWGRSIHTLPVTRDNKLVGVIGRRDVTKHFYAIVKEISGN